MTADRATYQQTLDQVDASGNASQRGEDCYTGQLLRFVMETNVGYVLPAITWHAIMGRVKLSIDFASESAPKVTQWHL